MNHDNKALTLEELRKMNNVPVWIENLEDPVKSQWRILHWDRGKYLVLQGISLQGYVLEQYEESWLAYAQKPIDFDDWTAEWKEYTGADAGFHYCSNCGQQAFNYEEDGEVIEVLSNFCPSCGKAMDDESRKMLEKRLTGHNNEQ